MTPAEAPARLKAFAFDYLVIFAYLLALGLVGALLTLGPVGRQWTEFMSHPVRADLFAFLVTVLPVSLYFTRGEASPSAATWGKRRVGLKVLGPHGGRLGFGRAFARATLKFLPWQMAHTAIFHMPGFLSSPGEPPLDSNILLIAAWFLVAIYLLGLSPIARGRTLYDRLTSTTVVRA